MALLRPEDSDAKGLAAKGLAADEVSNSSKLPRYQPGGADFLGPLENSAPLEAPRLRYTTYPRPPLAPTNSTPKSIVEPVDSMQLKNGLSDRSFTNPTQDTGSTQAQLQSTTNHLSDTPTLDATEASISLLEERLVIDHRKRKVGEVIIRKEIETRIVEVPIRREKLIVEQVSPEYKQLAVVDLGQQDAEFNAVEASHTVSSRVVNGNFATADAAIQFLMAISAQSNSSLKGVQVNLILDDVNLTPVYQQLLEQYSTKSTPY